MGSKRSKKKSPPKTAVSDLEERLQVLRVPSILLICQELYVSRLDSSLISSIASESNTLDEAKEILDTLANAAVMEDEVTRTMSYTSLASSSHSNASEEGHIKFDNTVTEADAFPFLRLSFSRRSEAEIKQAIQDSRGDVGSAFETLLNTEFTSTIKKEPIVEDYSDDSDDENSIWAQKRPDKSSRPKIAAVKELAAYPTLTPTSSPQKSPISSRGSSPARSKWDALESQITFLSQSLSLSPARVRSAFHTNASSLPRTLRALLKDIPDSKVDLDVVGNLKMTFKNVEEDVLRKIVVGTKHNLDVSVDLARILEHDKSYRTFPRSIGNKSSRTITLDITPQPALPTVVDDGEGSLEDMTSLKSYYLEKRNEAFVSASQSYRRSKSDRLQSGVAAYYANLGRDYDEKYRHYSQLASNRLVNQKSSANEIDLHGVTVKDAIRIVEEAVNAWWARCEVIKERGEIKAVECLEIIVGVGERSKGGSKLGPAVGGWLRRNGWGFNEARGAFLVWGLRKNAK